MLTCPTVVWRSILLGPQGISGFDIVYNVDEDSMFVFFRQGSKEEGERERESVDAETLR